GQADSGLRASFRPPLRLALLGTSPPLDGGEETQAAPPGVLPLPRRAGQRWFAKQIGVGVDMPLDPHLSSGPVRADAGAIPGPVRAQRRSPAAAPQPRPDAGGA